MYWIQHILMMVNIVFNVILSLFTCYFLFVYIWKTYENLPNSVIKNRNVQIVQLQHPASVLAIGMFGTKMNRLVCSQITVAQNGKDPIFFYFVSVN